MIKTTMAAAVAVILTAQAASTYLVIRAQERPAEVFVDHMQRMWFDGKVLRLEMGSERIGKPTPGQPVPVDRETVARVAITRDAAVALHRELGRVIAVTSPPRVAETL